MKNFFYFVDSQFLQTSKAKFLYCHVYKFARAERSTCEKLLNARLHSEKSLVLLKIVERNNCQTVKARTRVLHQIRFFFISWTQTCTYK